MRQKILYLALFLLVVIACGGDTQAGQVGIKLNTPITSHGHSGPTDGGVLKVFDAPVNGTNTTGVTVTNLWTTITSVNLGTVKLGDAFLCDTIAPMTKGATAGESSFKITKTGGTGSIVGMIGPASSTHTFYQVASTNINTPVFAIFNVDVGGTVTVSLQGISFGSNSTVSIGQATIQCWFMKRQ